MPTSIDVTIRDWLARYLAGEISLPEFEEWFVPATWNRVGRGDDRLNSLIGEIELRIAELTSKHRSEDDIKALLRPLLADPTPVFEIAPRRQGLTAGITMTQRKTGIVRAVPSSGSITQIQEEPRPIRHSSLVPRVEVQYSTVFA